jgi:hypothetical protein
MGYLLNSVNVQRQILIDRLIANGLNESDDKRSFQDLTLTELEREWRIYSEVGEVRKRA